MRVRTFSHLAMFAAVSIFAAASGCRAASTPKVGHTVPTSVLQTIDSQAVSLEEMRHKQRIVLVVLRGWPGYQCPLCTKQFAELRQHSDDFAARNALVVLVYPGPKDGLADHAKEFVHADTLPATFRFLLDPDFVFTNAWGLRWEAPNETAYPSAFVIGADGKISFAEVSNSHGGRVTASELLKALGE